MQFIFSKTEQGANKKSIKQMNNNNKTHFHELRKEYVWWTVRKMPTINIPEHTVEPSQSH